MSISTRPLAKVPSFSILEDDSDVFLPGPKKVGDSSQVRNRTHSDSVIRGKLMDSVPRRGLALSDSSNNPFNRSTSSSSLSSCDDFKFKKPLSRPKQSAIIKTQSRGQSTTGMSSSAKSIKRIGSKNRSQSVPNNENSYLPSLDFWDIDFYSNEGQNYMKLFEPMWDEEESSVNEDKTIQEMLADDLTLDENANDAFPTNNDISSCAENESTTTDDDQFPPIENLPIGYLSASPWDLDHAYAKESPFETVRDDPVCDEQPPAFLFRLDDRDSPIGCKDDCSCSRCTDEMMYTEFSSLSYSSSAAELREDCESPDESMSR